MVEDTEAIASNGPEARLQAYKNAPAKVNSSSNYTYSNNENPEYSGKVAPVKQTASQVLSQRDQIQQTKAAYPTPSPKEVSDRYPLAKSFTLTDKNAKPIDLSQVNKNISPKLQAGFSLGNEDVTQRNQVIQNSNRQVAIDNATNDLETLGFIDKAKAEGVTSFDILVPSSLPSSFQSSGSKIGSTTAEKALQDLQKYRAKGISVMLSYTNPQQENEVVPFLGLGNPFVSSSSESPISELQPQFKYLNSIISGEPNTSQLTNPTFGTKLQTEGIIPKSTTQLGSTSILDALQFIPIGRGAKTAQTLIEDELKNIRIPSTKTSTGLFGSEITQTRGTIPFGKSGISSGISGQSDGGVSVIITPKSTSRIIPSVTGIFEKIETPGKATTIIFQGETGKGIKTSTPESQNKKLEYISNIMGTDKGGSEPKGSSGGGSESKSSYKSIYSGTSDSLLKSFTSKSSKSDLLKSFTSNVSKSEILTQKYKTNSETKTKQKSNTINSFQSIEGKQSSLLITKPTSSILNKSPQIQKEKNTSLLVNGIMNDLLSESIQEEKGKYRYLFRQNTAQDTIQGQKQKQKYAPILNLPNDTPPGQPNPGKNPGLDILIPEKDKKKYRRLNPKGNRLNYIGNQPAGSIVGIYKRNDLSYGKVKANKHEKKDYSILTRGNPKLENKGHNVKKLSLNIRPKKESTQKFTNSYKLSSKFRI